MAYSVLTEPVIPILWLDGSSGAVGIREAFLRAHEIRDIQGDTPLEQYALLRLLIAFAMDMLRPKNSYARQDLLAAGKFDPVVFDEYVAMCEKDGPRFDLFDPEHPFMQSKYEEELDNKALKPVSSIIHALPSGNNHIFIDHRTAEMHEASIPQAFRALLASYLFCVSGTAGPSSVNNTPPLYCFILGRNLYETLMYNILSEAEAKPLAYGAGIVPWRSYQPIMPKKIIAEVSLLEGLTWMPRRITLLLNDNHAVQHVYCQAGLDFKGNDQWKDPFVPQFKKKDQTFGTIKPELGRAFWRDAGTLLYDQNEKNIRQPQVLKCIINVLDEDDMPSVIPVRAVGLVTNQAAYTTWCEDDLSIPMELLQSQEKADIFRADVSMIESVQNHLYSNVQKYVDKPRNGSGSKEHEIAVQCQQHFLHNAHDLLFGVLANEILEELPEKTHVDHLCDALKGALQEMIRQVLRASGNETKSLMQQITAEKWIWVSFSKITEERKKYYV